MEGIQHSNLFSIVKLSRTRKSCVSTGWVWVSCMKTHFFPWDFFRIAIFHFSDDVFACWYSWCWCRSSANANSVYQYQINIKKRRKKSIKQMMNCLHYSENFHDSLAVECIELKNMENSRQLNDQRENRFSVFFSANIVKLTSTSLIFAQLNSNLTLRVSQYGKCLKHLSHDAGNLISTNYWIKNCNSKTLLLPSSGET